MPKSLRFALWILAALALAAFAAAAYVSRADLMHVARVFTTPQRDWFIATAPPARHVDQLFDLGLVDADGDGRLDVFTANHNYRQFLWLDDGGGGYADALSRWGLDQVREFPGWEQDHRPPTTGDGGLYLYWHGDDLVTKSVGHSGNGPASFVLRTVGKIDVAGSDGFTARVVAVPMPDSLMSRTEVHVQAVANGMLRLRPGARGVPIEVELGEGVDRQRFHVGQQRVVPSATTFSLALRDRHGHAWADIDADGRLDVYISRGGVGGTLRLLPEAVRDAIRDEMLLSGGRAAGFADALDDRGFQKKDCSGRHARWVDFDGDGRLDLFVNCQNRGKAQGGFPKQLWRQGNDGRFDEVAAEVGLDFVDRELIDFVWLDADGDGRLDLLTSEEDGFFLYRNAAGRFERTAIGRAGFVRGDVAGTGSEVNNYWRFDGKLAAADFDGDGSVDVFASSKLGNVLLRQESGVWRLVDPTTIGLPARSVAAAWVDYDNDGRVDLHAVPDGLFRQTASGRFERTGLLALMPQRYQAAIVHWYDRDGDGRLDVLVALNDNPGLRRWWQRLLEPDYDPQRWELRAWRNVGATGRWLQLDIEGPPGNAQAVGAQVSLRDSATRRAAHVGEADGSYFSLGHYRLYFGLGDRERVERLEVRWSDGRAARFDGVAANQRLRLAPPAGDDAPNRSTR